MTLAPSHFSQAISIAMIVLNEEQNIGDCIKSCQNLGMLTIVDGGSEDNTVERITSMGHRVIYRKWTNFCEQKQHAVDLCATDWVLFLDADERLTPALISEIKNLSLDDQTVAYAIPRKTYFLGKEIHFCGWRPDYVTRLFNRTHVRFNDRPVHESVVGFSKTLKLTNPLLHFSYRNENDITRKIMQYSELGAQRLIKTRKSINAAEPFLRGAWVLVKTLTLKLGILDLKSGLQIAMMNYTTTKLKYIKAKELLSFDEGG